MKNDYDKYDYDLLLWYCEQDKKMDSFCFNITKELNIKLENCKNRMNASRKRKYEYTKNEIIGISLKLYLKYFKELEGFETTNYGDANE